jgi:4-amino-4-deoxy-L-arabinose transferase-like glycosyltransferase
VSPRLLVVAAPCTIAAMVASADGNLQYDDAGYLTRGFYHAAQVEERGDLFYLRLPWSLRFETPKAPLYTGLLALLAHFIPWSEVELLCALGAALPFAALLLGAAVLARDGGGPRAPPLALCALLASPLLVHLAARLLVETTLAALVVWGTVAAQRRCERPDLASEIGLGVASGLALLTKLLAPLFLAPVVLLAAAEVARREGVRRALRLVLVAAAVAFAVSALWYERNLATALGYAREAAQHAHSVDAGSPWTRPARLVWIGLGWPLLAGALGVAAFARRSPRPDGPRRRRLRRFALAAAAVSAAPIVAPPVFDPRFWAPAVALLAVSVGVDAAALVAEGPRLRRAAIASAAAACALASALLAARAPRWSTPWPLAELLAERASGREEPLAVCTMGAHPAFNVEKVRLVAEWARIRPRPRVTDVLHSGLPLDVAAAVAGCDLLFVLDPDETLPVHTQQLVNVDLRAARARLERDPGALRPDPTLEPRLGSQVSVEVYQRAPRPLRPTS